MTKHAGKIVSVLVMSLGLSIAHADIKSDKEAVNAACAQDAATAGCASEVVGKGLLKCLYKYKKDHKDYKFSEGCKSATKALQADHKEKKSDK